MLNIDLSEIAWNQASLPLRWGGIGVRSAHQLAPSAFLAFAVGAAELLTKILPERVLVTPDPAVARAKTMWRSMGDCVEPVGEESKIQRNWDEPCCRWLAEGLRVGADE